MLRSMSCEYLAELINMRGTSPLIKVDLEGSFGADDEELMPEEISSSLGTLFDAIALKNVKELVLAENTLRDS